MKLTFIMSALVALLCAVNAQAQITLKEYDTPGKSGVEKIIFNYTDPNSRGSVTKEFDVQANNPFNDIAQRTVRENPDGSKVKEFTLANRKQTFEQLGLKYDPDLGSSKVPLTGISHIMMSQGREKYLVLAYNLFLYGPHGDLSENGRLSTVKILNSKGEVVKSLNNIPTDVYSPKVSNNGKYLFYAYGEPIEHAESFPDKSGFKIIDITSSEVIFDIQAYRTSGIFVNGKEVNITADEKGGEFIYSFNENSADLFRTKRENIGAFIGFQTYLGLEGDTLRISDFEQVK